MNIRLVVVCFSAVVALTSLRADAQTVEQPRDTARSVKRRTPPTIETAKVAEVLQVDDNGFKFVAYVVLWNGHRIVVEDPMGDTTHQVGHDIKFAVMRHQVSRNPDKKILAFMVVPDSACRPPASDAGSPGTKGAPCAGQELPAPLPPSSRSPEGAAADQILRNMTQAYATLQSYTDHGTVTIRPDEDEDSDHEGTTFETTFETAFARPNLFRFAWATHYPGSREAMSRSVLWSDGTAVYTRWDRGLTSSPDAAEVEEEDSLELAIAGATGVSAGSAHNVPRLLMPEIGGSSLGELHSPTLVGEESVEGVPCHHVVGQFPDGSEVDVWIGVEDHLVRKVAWSFSEEIRRNVRINENIPADRFMPEEPRAQPFIPEDAPPKKQPQADMGSGLASSTSD